jgi:hypothetical protein
MRFLAGLLVTSTAVAAPLDVTTAPDGSSRARQPVAPTAVTHAKTRTLYLDRDGGTLTPGANNSQANTTTLVDQMSTIAGWSVDDAGWAETVACVRAMWSHFDIEITDVDPGTTPHIQVHIGGSPTSIGFPPKIGGVSPMAIDCSIVEHSIVFVFPQNLRNDPQTICEVVGQEVGHSYGLDHELEPSDPMTYLSFIGDRTFQDKTASCGESSPRPCGIGGHTCRANQNSFRLLLDRLGAPGSDHDPPTLAITTPRDGDTVEPGFSVIASATDDVGVDRITLYIDGDAVISDQHELALSTDPSLPAGRHELLIEVADAADNTTIRRLAVDVDDGERSSSSDFMPTIGCSTGTHTNAVWLVLGLLALRRRRMGTDLTCNT